MEFIVNSNYNKFYIQLYKKVDKLLYYCADKEIDLNTYFFISVYKEIPLLSFKRTRYSKDSKLTINLNTGKSTYNSPIKEDINYIYTDGYVKKIIELIILKRKHSNNIITQQSFNNTISSRFKS